jgi:uncharacterized protein YhfF
MLNNETASEFWQTYLETLPNNHPYQFLETPDAWSFGDSPELADTLGSLVLQGTKTATCCRYLGENILENNRPSIVTNCKGQPLCIIESTEITVRCFLDVDAKFAADEGEGDLSLGYWRREHWDSFNRESVLEGYEVSEEMLLKCVRFQVLYRTQDHDVS